MMLSRAAEEFVAVKGHDRGTHPVGGSRAENASRFVSGHDFSRAVAAGEFVVVKGHDFSRAEKRRKDLGALAPEGMLPGIRTKAQTTTRSLSLFSAPSSQRGLTLAELIVTTAILTILMSAAVPLVRFQVKRQKERELHYDLWMMRDAIDKYKDAADRGAFQTKIESQNYPPDLETLVNGVDVQGKKVRFLRKIPVDPMTGQAEWGMRSMQDDPDSDSWGGQSVFDVHSKSQGTALDGTKYATW
jgi:general secretion pathway protein G